MRPDSVRCLRNWHACPLLDDVRDQCPDWQVSPRSPRQVCSLPPRVTPRCAHLFRSREVYGRQRCCKRGKPQGVVMPTAAVAHSADQRLPRPRTPVRSLAGDARRRHDVLAARPESAGILALVPSETPASRHRSFMTNATSLREMPGRRLIGPLIAPYPAAVAVNGCETDRGWVAFRALALAIR